MNLPGRIRLLSFLVFLGSCESKIYTKISVRRPPLSPYSPVILVPKETELPLNSEPIGRIWNGAFFAPITCDYYSISRKMERSALAAGANLIVIIEDKRVKNQQECHQIKGNLYFVPDVARFEKTIRWSPIRALKPQDFKGVGLNRSGEFSISKGIQYFSFSKGLEFHIESETIFNCYLSYLVDSIKVGVKASHLEFANLVFDFDEVVRRSFLAEAKKQIRFIHGASPKLDSVYYEKKAELDLVKDRFINGKTKARKDWQSWNLRALDSLKEFSESPFVLKLKK
jgi:hypothetical protein